MLFDILKDLQFNLKVYQICEGIRIRISMMGKEVLSFKCSKIFEFNINHCNVALFSICVFTSSLAQQILLFLHKLLKITLIHLSVEILKTRFSSSAMKRQKMGALCPRSIPVGFMATQGFQMRTMRSIPKRKHKRNFKNV